MEAVHPILKKGREIWLCEYDERVFAACNTEGEKKSRTPIPLCYIWTQQNTITWPPLPSAVG